MMADEWKEIMEDVESLWGRTAKWAKADRSFKYAQMLPAKAARSAVESIYLDGADTAPSPAKVLKLARELVVAVNTPDEIERFCTRIGHTWGIVGEEQGIRTVVCARCGIETTKVSTLVPTESELEEGIGGKDIDDAALTDRIAP